jgi:Metallo-peptidase family M12/Secretion system C-terminal sorting domain/CUB domain
MKNTFFYFLLISCFFGFSQQEVPKKAFELISRKAKFELITPFVETPNVSNSETSKIIDKATFASLNLDEINKIVSNKYENIELEIPYQGKTINVFLYKVNLFAEGFHVDTEKSKNIKYQKGVYYRGMVKDDLNSIVSFNFFKNECNGIVSNTELSNLVIGKLEKANNVLNYIIYKDEDLKILNNSGCQTKDNVEVPENTTQKNIQSTRCVSMYFEIDNNLYVSNGSNTTTTTNWMTSVFNNVQTLYTNDGITTSLKSMFIWTTADPYNNIGTTSSAYLSKFHQVRPVFDGDVGQLVGIDPGGLGGVAVTINGLCKTGNYSYSDVNLSYSTVPIYSWTVEVITHEFGHLLGSPHTHACIWNGNNTAIDNCAAVGIGASAEGYSCYVAPGIIPSATTKGSIMSYCHLVSGIGINFNNGFGLQPKNRILNAVNNGTCLSTDCISTCINKITSSGVSNINSTSATLNWTETGGTISSEVSVFPLSSSSGIWETPTTNTFVKNGLTPNTYYKAVFRNTCSGGLIGATSSTIFVTSGDFCSGIPLTDSGGATGNYRDDELIIRTIIPTNPNAKAKITFTAFDLEIDYDYLNIYNGPNDTFPNLTGTALGFTGTTIPAPIESTATDGSLTLKFYSDSGVVNAGYEATVSCSTVLATNTFDSLIDFSYAPNPTTNAVSITSKTEISEVEVYSITGQLLYQSKPNDLRTNVDISSFSNGTYFFKLKFGEKEVNFKILKM